MSLTPKQEAFCLAYLETGNASEAYRRSYDAENMSDPVVRNKASALLAKGDIRVRLDELREPVTKAAQLTLETHLADLKMLRDKALEAEQYSAAITAETNRGKAAGLYTEKHELTGANGGPVETVTRIELVALGDDSTDSTAA